MLQTRWGRECDRLLVCVDSYESSVMKGRFCRASREPEGFESLAQFLVKTEQALDEMGQPQSYTIPRQFGELPPEDREEISRVPGRGKKATFELRVLFRQHTSWQGVIHWQERRQEQSFRSVLELVLLMDSALRSVQ